MSEQYVYFIQADENGPIKIGFTADDPKRRLNQLQTGNASTLKLLGAVKGSLAREKQFHAELSPWRLQGEWFESHPTVLAAVQAALSSASEPVEHGDACLHCSFCFQCQHDVDVLIVGSAANICAACCAVAVELVAKQKATKVQVLA